MSFFQRLLSLLYPRKCPFCRQVIAEDALCCKKCEREISQIPVSLMPRRISDGNDCYSLYRYENTVRESLLRFKFHGAAAYSETYGKFLAKYIDENGIFCDIVTWVPVSSRRKRQRGYDQAKLLADALGEAAGLECRRLLKKLRNNQAQSGTTSVQERRKNVAGVYAAVNEEKIKDKRILLVDDIVTTGATLSACARVLKEAGARQVIALTVAATLHQ